MATLVHEAIEIITDAGYGVPVSYSNSAYGLASDGHFYLITDRPTISTVTGDTTQTTWYQGILTRDFGSWTISRNIDFVEAGGMEEVSGFTVGIKNTADFRTTLETNGVYLGRRRIKYYRVTSSDASAYNFELRWTGLIDEQPFNELLCSLRCVDASKDIFGSLPVTAVNHNDFVNAPEDSGDKMVPIAVGRVAYSPLVNVSAQGAAQTLAVVSGVEHKLASSLSYVDGAAAGSKTLYLYTPGITFTADDYRLVGKYLKVMTGGDPEVVRITTNVATGGGAYADVTYVTIASALSATPTPYVIASPSITAWYFSVIDYGGVLVASNREIMSYESAAAQYSTDAKSFVGIMEIEAEESTSNIQSTGFPGITAYTDVANESGSMVYHHPIVPSRIEVVSTSNWASSNLPAAGSQAPDLMDRSDSTYYTLTRTATGSAYITLDVYFPEKISFREFDELCLMYDFTESISTGSQTSTLNAVVSAVDIYGNAISLFSRELLSHTVTTTAASYRTLTRQYVNTTGSDSSFYANKDNMDLASYVQNSDQTLTFKKIRVAFEWEATFPANYTLKLEEVGFVAKSTVTVTTEPVYKGLIGEVYGNTLDGRVSAVDYPATVPDAITYLTRNYDERAREWEAGRAYAAGEYIRSTADNGQVFVCTVAGTSHATTEPTWTDTAGATYTDNTVTWKQHHEMPIDYDDDAFAYRAGWLVGRTLTEKKPSLEYYRALLAQSFMLGRMTAAGKFQIVAWLEYETPGTVFSSSNIIQGSVSEIQSTPVRRLYNDLLIRYDKNPGSGKYNKQIQVTKIDKPAFPDEGDTLYLGTAITPFSATYTAYEGGIYKITIAATNHGVAVGDYVALSNNTEGFSFRVTLVIAVPDANTFEVLTFGNAFTATSSTSGDLKKHVTSRLAWREYVSGIENYTTAKDLWDMCHASYLITKAVNPLPNDLGDCEWYFDPYARNAYGGYAWSDDGGITCNLDLGDEHAAVYFAQNLASWTAWQKKQVTFETADNSTMSAVVLGNCVSFNDARLTGGSAIIGWVHEKTQLPRDANNPERFRFGVTLKPEPLNTYSLPDIIDENGADGTLIYDENGATDIIEENL